MKALSIFVDESGDFGPYPTSAAIIHPNRPPICAGDSPTNGVANPMPFFGRRINPTGERISRSLGFCPKTLNAVLP